MKLRYFSASEMKRSIHNPIKRFLYEKGLWDSNCGKIGPYKENIL
jgi:hypothetical protein